MHINSLGATSLWPAACGRQLNNKFCEGPWSNMFNHGIPISYLVGQLTISSHMFVCEIHDCKFPFWWVQPQYILIFLVNFLPLKTQFHCSCHNFILFNGMITTMLQTPWVRASELGRYKGKMTHLPLKRDYHLPISYMYPVFFKFFTIPWPIYHQTCTVKLGATHIQKLRWFSPSQRLSPPSSWQRWDPHHDPLGSPHRGSHREPHLTITAMGLNQREVFTPKLAQHMLFKREYTCVYI